MAGEIEKINEIFRIHDEKKKISDEEKPEKENTAHQAAPAEEKKEAYKTGKQKISAVDKLFIALMVVMILVNLYNIFRFL